MFNVVACIATEHDLRLVGLAAAVCLVATLATFHLYAKVPTFPMWRRWTWLLLTGLVSGSGIWTTHFVGMLAFATGLPTGYAAGATLASLGVAVLSTTLGFALGAPGVGGVRTRRRALLAGSVVGLGITLMHYLGMAGYRTTGRLEWDGLYVASSVLVGTGLAALAMGMAGPGANARRQIGAGLVLTLAIVGMHFTGMTAVTIWPDPTVVVPASFMHTTLMATSAVAVTVLIIVAAIAGVAFDTASRNGNLRRLREALDVMPEGLAFYDASDRLVAWNTQYEDLCRAGGATLAAGMPFLEVLNSQVVHGAYPEAHGREADWIAERTAARWGDGASLTQRTAGGRWLRITDRRTAEGGTVSVSVDVTDLKRAETAMADARDRAEEQARRADAAEAMAGLGHWRLDAATRELTWSPQLYRIFGLAEGTALDVPAVLAMSHPEDAATITARHAAQLERGEEVETIVTRIIRPNGELRYLSGKGSVERGPDGRIVAAIGTVVDVTEQILAEAAIAASQERFRRLAVNAPDMIAESGLDGVLTYISPVCLAITGFTSEELTGQTYAALMEPEDARRVQEMCQTVFAGKGAVAPWSVEFRARHKSGAELWLECRPTLCADPQTGRWVGLTDVIRDVTARKRMEADLHVARAEAEAAAQVKSEFLANMSHELRTPLTSIIGFTGLAAEQNDLGDLTRNYVERVRDASRALLCTVNDILDFSKLEAGQVSIQPQPIDLVRLCRGALDLFTPQAGAKDLDLVLRADDTGAGAAVLVDPDRVRQILLNLISNAVKFTASGGVTLSVDHDAAAGRVRIAVIDTGAGIAPDKRDRLFQRFSQVDGSLTRAQGGTGLGLAICKGLVEAMGGEIGIESTAGEGSCFWFEIPAPATDLSDAAEAPGAENRLSFEGVRVLVVDDHATNRDLVRLFLAGVGAQVEEAVDGVEAVQMAAEMPYDAILMDMRMPRLDGEGALAQIRAGDGPNDRTPILAFTADATPDLWGRLTAQGFEDIVAKPVEPAALIAAIAQATAFASDVNPLKVVHA